MSQPDQRDSAGARGPRSATHHATTRTGVALGLCLLVAAIVLGCSETTRYRVLSFFFDGVPPPGSRAAGANNGLAGDQPAGGPTTRTASFHAPFAQRRCFQCHGVDEIATPDVSQSSLCANCHATYVAVEANDWVHGPVAAGQCSFCHVGHESKHLSLQRQPQPELCWRCHDAGRVTAKPYHAGLEGRRCTNCHDPHAAGNRLLLADARTYRRRGGQAELSVHEPWRQRRCSECHTGTGAEMVVSNPDETCRRCHEQTLSRARAEKHHAPVREGKCSLCHVSHSSPLPHLLRPAGAAICRTCHKGEQLRTPPHPPVTHVDCFLCHRGHQSSRENLLKRGIPE